MRPNTQLQLQYTKISCKHLRQTGFYFGTLILPRRISMLSDAWFL